MLIGYARVSTLDQTTDAQVAQLRAAGCTRVEIEHASGADRARPVLRQVLARIRPGDTLVVVRIDRLARSLSHLLQILERLERRGAWFRSLSDPIDTASAQGLFTLQVLGAAAEFERALIRERTLAGLEAARARGRVGGNPRLKAREPQAIAQLRRARDESYFNRITDEAESWVPELRRMRPDLPWQDVVRAINARLPDGARKWTQARLIRAARRYVRDGLLPAEVLDRAPRRSGDDRLLVLVAGLRRANPDMTLAQIAQRLESMRIATPRGHARWYPSSVRVILQRAERAGLLAGG
ncbi:DNA invertase Pin-like site-specific DNA recombinase [Albidovulum inexpectatum]|uniref:DNA invertase Pin-like site-specific DNA recombinase n=1 Tax=Albidovulum inexpectatum TaxID=196587 RepID=A0A2S5JH57_9RHOB|nr:recombinase family protein [Albidovulum inexpectatum]PPB80721.1 DNA invertase Pin-like site-specific DNA recombinase [Albidovulum inexpectatum]